MHVKDVSAQGTGYGLAVMGRMIVQSSRLPMAKDCTRQNIAFSINLESSGMMQTCHKVNITVTEHTCITSVDVKPPGCGR